MAEENKARYLTSWAVSQISNTLRSLADSLSRKTFSVEVENQIDNTELLKEVAKNTRGVKGKIEELIQKPNQSIDTRLDELIELQKHSVTSKQYIKSIEDPIEAKILNPSKFPETISVSNFPKEITVSNLKDLKIDFPEPEKPQKIDLLPLEKAVKDLKSSFQDVARLLPSLKTEPVVIPAFPEPKPFPKEISFTEGKEIAEEIQGLRADIEQLYKLLEEKEFGNGSGTGKVEVTNFPPQHIPTPVTNININSLRGIPLTTAVTVTSSPTPLPTRALMQRRTLMIYNNSSNTVYIGGSTVSISNGFPVTAGAYSPPIDAGDQMVVYGIASGSSNVRVLEVSNDQEGN